MCSRELWSDEAPRRHGGEMTVDLDSMVAATVSWQSQARRRLRLRPRCWAVHPLASVVRSDTQRGAARRRCGRRIVLRGSG